MRKLTTEQWVAKAVAIHGTKYDYSKVAYQANNINVVIVCPIHGPFEQAPSNHLKSPKGCPYCAGTLKSNTKEFIRKAILVHKDKYDYTQVDYTGKDNNVTIICPVHGPFEQTPHTHLCGRGCRECGVTSAAKIREVDFESFVKRSKQLHGGIFEYHKDTYTRAKKSTKITCKQCGYTFKRIPSAHMFTKCTHCPNCSSYGFNPKISAYLYYLKITTEDNQVLYKIGITNRTVEQRFNLTDLQKIEIVKQKLYEVGSEALEWETKLKYKYKQYQYTGPAVLKDGNTELFTEDIIAMWYNENNTSLEIS